MFRVRCSMFDVRCSMFRVYRLFSENRAKSCQMAEVYGTCGPWTVDFLSAIALAKAEGPWTSPFFDQEHRLTDPVLLTYFPRLAGWRNQRHAPTFFSD